jgi:hypothetical protein
VGLFRNLYGGHPRGNRNIWTFGLWPYCIADIKKRLQAEYPHPLVRELGHVKARGVSVFWMVRKSDFSLIVKSLLLETNHRMEAFLADLLTSLSSRKVFRGAPA